MTSGARKKETLVLIDGHGLVHRAYHAIRGGLSTRSGEPTTAVYGFTSALLKTVADLKPDHLAVAFDHASGPTIRIEKFDQYKAQRPSMPDDLRVQIPRVRQMVEAFDIPVYELAGYEADDLIGTLARQAAERGLHVVIVTGDTDLLQLVTPDVDVLMNRSLADSFYYTEDKVKERYEGLTPRQIIDLKALKGDTSDNVPGVAKVGEKTATQLIKQFGSVEGIYENLEVVAPLRVQEALRAGRDNAFQGKDLVTIDVNAPVVLDMERVRWGGYDRSKVTDLFRELEFSSLLTRLPKEKESADSVLDETSQIAAPAPFKEIDAEFHAVTTREALDALVRRILETQAFTFDTETTSTSPLDADLVGLAIAVDNREGFYVPVRHLSGDQVQREEVVAAFKPLFEDESVAKIAHNAQYDISILLNEGIQVRGLAFDTMLAAHLLGENQVGLKTLAFQKLNVEMTPITELIGRGQKQITMDQVEIAKVAPYAGADAVMTYRLWELLQKDLREANLENTFHTVEMPLVSVLMRMERAGITVDPEQFKLMAGEFRERLNSIEQQIYYWAGEQFNINSTQQLGTILFDKLHLPPQKRTTKGYSTDVSVLESLKGQHEIITLLLDYRQVSKLLSTYVEALPKAVNSKTGRVHTNFNQTGSATGRVASTDPNLQNIPVRTQLGRRIRDAFVVGKPDNVFLAADYSQVELRVLAHLSQDPRMMQAFENDEDIHAAAAAEILHVPREQVTSDMRRIAKTVNFGIAYGVTGFGLATRLEMPRAEADAYIKTYFDRYPKVREWIEATKRAAREKGYVETIMGRRRYVPDIRSSNANIRQAAERVAINTPVQGTAADIIKLAMIKLQERMDALHMDAQMLLQIHDELIFELPESERDRLAALVTEVMPNAVHLTVPLKVDIKVGKDWGELE